MSSIPTTLVLLDPTSSDGESALGLLDHTDRHVTLLVLISGGTAQALEQFASVEHTSLATAGNIYLDQVRERVAADHVVESILTSGPSCVDELSFVMENTQVGRVLLPSSIERLEPGALGRLTKLGSARVQLAAPPGRAA